MLFAVLTAFLQVLGWQANRAAADNTEQLVRVQNIQSTLFRADALATNSFLVGGLEPPEQRQAYDDAIDQVTRLIADAAEAQPADREVLGALNAAVNRYTTTNTQARDNNRQGFPVGAEYLRGASNQLRADVAVTDQALIEANSDAGRGRAGGAAPALAAAARARGAGRCSGGSTASSPGVFRRRFNVGSPGPFAAWSACSPWSRRVRRRNQDGANDEPARRRLPHRRSTRRPARTAANDAKSNESLGSGAHGSGAVFEEGWRAASRDGRGERLARHPRLWQRYSAPRRGRRARGDGRIGRRAVALATATEPDGPTAALDAVDASAAGRRRRRGADATDELRSGDSIFLVLAVLTLLRARAAGAATWGIAQRRREYA